MEYLNYKKSDLSDLKYFDNISDKFCLESSTNLILVFLSKQVWTMTLQVTSQQYPVHFFVSHQPYTMVHLPGFYSHISVTRATPPASWTSLGLRISRPTRLSSCASTSLTSRSSTTSISTSLPGSWSVRVDIQRIRYSCVVTLNVRLTRIAMPQMRRFVALI